MSSNGQLTIEGTMTEWVPFLPDKTYDRADRIRNLVGAARVCIIEVGRELLAEKAERPHGD